MGPIMCITDTGPIHAIMQISTRRQADRLVLHRRVEILKQGGIAPGLVGGMRRLPLAAAQPCANDRILGCCGDVTPLLELDDHAHILPPLIGARDDNVDAFGGLGDSILNGDAGDAPG